MYVGLTVKYLLFLLDFSETSILLKDFRKRLKSHINENPPSGGRVVANGRTDDGQTGKQT
jgi:hypothetical protein